jgi:formylglycine-generating enzyme required for sulfatase activity
VGGSVKVADFGLAKLLEHSRATATGAMTPAYAAPEFLNKEVSAHSDQYSLAASYCQLRGGRLPFTGDTSQILTGHLLHPPDLTMLPEAERPAVAKALAKKPEDRWPSCRAFAQAVAVADPDEGDTSPKPSSVWAAPTMTRRGRRSRRLWPAAALVGVLLLLAAALPVALVLSGALQGKRGDADTPDRADNAPPSEKDKDKAAPPPAKDNDKVGATPPDKDKGTAKPPERDQDKGAATPEKDKDKAGPATPEKDKDKGAPPPPPPRPALRLPAIPAVALEAGESKTITVRVERENFAGPVRLEVGGLPDGVSARPAVVPDGKDSADVVLSAADSAAVGDGRGTLTARAGDVRADGPIDVTVALGKEYTNTIGMKLKRIKEGTFTIGSPDKEEGRFDNEGPQHEVTITKPFYLGVYPVTRGQFAAFAKDAGYKTEAETDGKGGYGYNATKKGFEQDTKYSWRNPGFDQPDDHPVVNVTWNDAKKFCEWLSKKEGKTYELPTEAEWEYACRAGTTTRFWCGDKDEDLKGNANLADASFKEKYPDGKWAVSWDDGYPFTSPVGKFKPNPWGLYDMHGNVWQWCADGYGKYENGSFKDPKGPDNGEYRVLRGGSLFYDPRRCRSAHRRDSVPGKHNSDVGFRVVLRPPAGTP